MPLRSFARVRLGAHAGRCIAIGDGSTSGWRPQVMPCTKAVTPHPAPTPTARRRDTIISAAACRNPAAPPTGYLSRPHAPAPSINTPATIRDRPAARRPRSDSKPHEQQAGHDQSSAYQASYIGCLARAGPLPVVALRSSSHRTQLSSIPSRLRRPCSVITQGRSTYGGSWRTC